MVGRVVMGEGGVVRNRRLLDTGHGVAMRWDGMVMRGLVERYKRLYDPGKAGITGLPKDGNHMVNRQNCGRINRTLKVASK